MSFLQNLARRSAGLDAVLPVAQEWIETRSSAPEVAPEAAFRPEAEAIRPLTQRSGQPIIEGQPAATPGVAAAVPHVMPLTPAPKAVVQRSPDAQPATSVTPAPISAHAEPIQASPVAPTLEHSQAAIPPSAIHPTALAVPAPSPPRLFDPVAERAHQPLTATSDLADGEWSVTRPDAATPTARSLDVVVESTHVERVVEVAPVFDRHEEVATEAATAEPEGAFRSEPQIVPVTAGQAVHMVETRQEERTVHVRIGAIEIHAPPPPGTPPQPPPPTPPAVATASRGFEEYARLRRHAPWTW